MASRRQEMNSDVQRLLILAKELHQESTESSNAPAETKALQIEKLAKRVSNLMRETNDR